MSTLGQWGSFPFSFGGDAEPEEVVYSALLLALSPEPGVGYDVSDPLLQGEIASYAGIAGGVWNVNERLSNQVLPLRMLEALPDAEAILKIRPTPEQSDDERRAVVAGKTIALRGNTMSDIEAAVRAVAGDQFVAVWTAPESSVYCYWPYGSPGPPGQEWSSNRCFVKVQITKAGLGSQAAFLRLRSSIEALLHVMLPSAHTFAVSTSDGFILGESILGEDSL